MHLISLALILPLVIPLTPPASAGAQGQIVVANRGDQTLSVIDVQTDTVTHTLQLPGSANPAEPMYVEPAAGLVFVGDRANDCLVVYDPGDWSQVGTVLAGDGVFHMKADAAGRQLWVVNDVDKTLSVIDPQTLTNVGTVPIPADLAALGGKPHDVVVGSFHAYVSIVGVSGDDDYVVQYKKWNLREGARAAVGKDPHLALSPFNPWLFVPTQGANEVRVLRRQDLGLVTQIPTSGAHGAWMARSGRILYTTNLPGGGPGGLVILDARNHTLLGTVDTPYATPHNVAATPLGTKVYVTHSGASADKVTIYGRAPGSAMPALVGEVTAGANPFGISYVP